MALRPLRTSPARDRLLQAAGRVFAREGLQGATTRKIAQEAGVNEVTLFRLFESKERLLAEVLKQERLAQSETLAGGGSEWTYDIRTDLRNYARSFNVMLEKYEAMIRTLIGEAQRRPQHARQVIHDSVRPARDRFIAYLDAARQRGLVRDDLKLAAAADMFTGTLLAGMLRRSSSGARDYSATAYIDTCVEIFVAGIAPQARALPAKKKAPAKATAASKR